MPVRYSHPPEDGHDGIHLIDHLDDVAARVRYVVPEEARTPTGESLRDVVETLAYIHDFGKATTYFQQYIGTEAGSPEREQYRYHAPIGSFVAYYALDSQGFERETCLAGFVAVAKHHGRLPDVATYSFERSHRRKNVSGGNQNAAEKQQTAVAMQITDIEKHVPGLAEEIFQKATTGDGSWNSFREGFVDLLGEIESAVATAGTSPGINRASLSEACYALVLECWGSLVLADKTSAAAAVSDTEPSPSTYRANQPPLQQLETYVQTLEQNANADPDGTRAERLNHYRSRARRTVIENAERFATEGGGVATLTLPTGMGKTLSGLSAALTIRNHTGGDRVVYALPFTSIIDQVVDEIAEIYKVDVTSRLLTAHHHLSETTIRDRTSDADTADLSDDVAGMLAESWRAGLTVTTFVQLFESLAGPSNRQSMKLPALWNSVVVLDEPQSLPLDWWKLVPRLVTLLTEQYDATVISMTATQPQLFDNKTRLVDRPERYFEATERVTYRLDSSVEQYIEKQEDPKSYESAAEEVERAIDANESTLAVCNTIDSTRKLTDCITEIQPSVTNVAEVYTEELHNTDNEDEIKSENIANCVESRGEWSLLHLSTRLRPVDRLRLIDSAKELTDRGHTLIAVSTQLVEAGVDISFDRVYRDLAPVDSIVQAAGRCNRSFERDRGDVTVWWLDTPEDQQKTPAEAVYNRDTALLPVAAEILDSVRGGGECISETTVARTAVNRYYQRLHEEKNVGKREYATYVDEARGDKLAGLSLIDQRRAVDVVICRTTKDRETLEAIRGALDRYDFSTVNSLMKELRTRQISIPIYQSDSKEARELSDLPRIHSETDIRYVDPSAPQFKNFFDPVTGFVIPDSTVERRFL